MLPKLQPEQSSTRPILMETYSHVDSYQKHWDQHNSAMKFMTENFLESSEDSLHGDTFFWDHLTKSPYGVITRTSPISEPPDDSLQDNLDGI